MYAKYVYVVYGYVAISKLNLKTSPMYSFTARNQWTYFKVKRSKVEVTRPTNAVADNAPYAGRGIMIFLKN